MDEALWCYKMDWVGLVRVFPGGVRYRAHYGAHNGIKNACSIEDVLIYFIHCYPRSSIFMPLHPFESICIHLHPPLAINHLRLPAKLF